MQDATDAVLYNTVSLAGALDLSAFTNTGQTDKNGQQQVTRGEQMNRLHCRWTPVEKWPGSRVAGIQNFHRLLAPNPKSPDRPGIVFFSRCVNALRTIPRLPRDDRDTEDIDDNAEDHAFDGVRYGIQFRRGRFKRVTVGGI